MHSSTLYYVLTLLLASASTTLSAPIPPSQLTSSSSSIFTTHFHSLLSERDSPHAALLERARREIEISSNLLPRSASPHASTLYPSLHHHFSSSEEVQDEEDEGFEPSSSPVPSRSLDMTFRSPRLDGREGRVSRGGWLSWVAAAPRG